MYTRQGDRGKTFIFSGKRVYKDNIRVQAYGDVDELNSLIGVCIAFCEKEDVRQRLKEIQGMLFVAGADLATELSYKKDVPRISQEHIEKIEKRTDEVFEKIPRITKFILPGGSRTSSLIHLARAVCRRAERKIVSLSKREKINVELIAFFNRLSTYLFDLARYNNYLEGFTEEFWEKC